MFAFASVFDSPLPPYRHSTYDHAGPLPHFPSHPIFDNRPNEHIWPDVKLFYNIRDARVRGGTEVPTYFSDNRPLDPFHGAWGDDPYSPAMGFHGYSSSPNLHQNVRSHPISVPLRHHRFSGDPNQPQTFRNGPFPRRAPTYMPIPTDPFSRSKFNGQPPPYTRPVSPSNVQVIEVEEEQDSEPVSKPTLSLPPMQTPTKSDGEESARFAEDETSGQPKHQSSTESTWGYTGRPSQEKERGPCTRQPIDEHLFGTTAHPADMNAESIDNPPGYRGSGLNNGYHSNRSGFTSLNSPNHIASEDPPGYYTATNNQHNRPPTDPVDILNPDTIQARWNELLEREARLNLEQLAFREKVQQEEDRLLREKVELERQTLDIRIQKQRFEEEKANFERNKRTFSRKFQRVPSYYPRSAWGSGHPCERPTATIDSDEDTDMTDTESEFIGFDHRRTWRPDNAEKELELVAKNALEEYQRRWESLLYRLKQRQSVM